MDEPHKASLDPQQECLARVVWAAHILFYLTKTRRHEELPEAESNVDSDSNTDDSSNDDTDYQTEKNTILSGPQDSIRRKFLDCIAQLLSPCKGRDGVTATAMREGEDGVEVDISRNDRFLSDGECFDGDILGYREMLEKYLEDSSGGMNATANSPTDFELKVIDYMSRRVDRWVEDFQKTLGRHRGGRDWNSQRWSGQETAVEAWTTMMDLTIKFDAGKEDVHSRSLLVQQAYNCLNSTPIRELLSDTLGDQGDLRLWNKLKFIARPLVDCRLLKAIAIREPRLRNCKILLVSSESNTILETKRRLGIFQAWERLGLDTIPGPVFQKLDPCSEEFEEACAKTFSLHAEMQLLVHYEERRARWPTLDYFGCSKKTCLLCETVLRALPTPIATRGRHGICYPAWAVPDSKSGDVQVAVQRLEKGLVARIQRVVSDLTEPKQRGQALNIVQSDLVSDFSRFTLEELQRREQHVSLFEDEQIIKQGDLLKMEGIVPATESRYDPVENFEPQNSCVMCNKIPATQCAQCRSIFYCSADCARSDCPSHSLLCKQFATEPDRPSPEYKRAIYFPAERENPCLIWVPCRRRYDEEDGISWTQIDPYPYLGSDHPIRGTMRIEHNPVRCRNLGSGFTAYHPRKEGYCVALVHRDAYLRDGSTANRSILASVRASCVSILPHEYRGPMIALRELPHENYADITLADFRHIIDYLIKYRDRCIRESVPDRRHLAPTTVRGVKICCYGETKVHGSEPFISVDITRTNRISLGQGSISPISVCLGMPIRLWKDPDTPFLHDPPGWEEGMAAYSNDHFSSLMLETNPSKDEWGWAPMYSIWDSEIGNVWAVREDGQDLAVEDVAMMCHFATHKVRPMFEDVMEEDSGLVGRQKVLDFITWDNMVAYRDELGEHNSVAQEMED